MARPPEPTRSRDLQQFRDELRATLAARRELSPEMEDTLVTNFLQQIERAIDARVDARVAEVTRQQVKRSHARTGTIAASMALSIPIVAIAGGIAHETGLIVALVVVLLINIIHAWRP